MIVLNMALCELRIHDLYSHRVNYGLENFCKECLGAVQ